MIFLLLLMGGVLDTRGEAQSTYEEFFPLQVGNWWYYHQIGTIDRYFKVEITDTTSFEGKNYYILDGLYLGFNRYIRFDSTKQFLVSYITNADTNQFFQDTTLYFSAPVCSEGFENCFYWNAWFGDGSARSWVADSSFNTRYFKFDGQIWRAYYLLKGVGIISGSVELSSLTLLAAYVNGDVYGDTSIVKLRESSENLPEKTRLLQNYPNPFNNQTSIHLVLHKSQLINIDVYNVRGQMVQTLFTGWKNAGSHIVTWDGKNYNSEELGTGIYFIRLKAKNSKSVIKAVLTK